MVSVLIDGVRLRELRTLLRVSGPKLSEYSGVSQPMISQIETGHTRAGLETFSMLVNALATLGGFKTEELGDWLLGGPDAPTGTPIINK